MEGSRAVRRAAAGGRTAVAAGRMDRPRMMMDKEVLLPVESTHRGPAPECRPQILSHSAFRFSEADCAGSPAGASSDIPDGTSRQISQRPFSASGNRSRKIESLRVIWKTPKFSGVRQRLSSRFCEGLGRATKSVCEASCGGRKDPKSEGYFFPGVVAGCTMPCLKCCSSEWLQISSPMSHGFSLNIRLAVKDWV